MANGYLGKISAIVTANTSDFQAKLGDAAGGVRKFSREVQSNITKAMGDVEKSIQSIYTPLQRLEGSLKAAGGLKLSFQGFAGAIKDVEDLKGRLGELSATQVKIVLDQSGLKSIKEVRSALREVSNRDIRLFDAAGSVRELQKIQAGLDTARGQKKLAKLGIDETELDALIQKLQRFPAQKIKAVIDVLGKDMLDSSFDRAQKLFSLSQQINKPLEAAMQSFTGLSREVQAGFIPTLGRAQNEAQSLADDIKRGCDIGQARFEAVEDSVNGVTIAIKQLNEAASLVGNLKTGRELAFDQPGLSSALTRGVKFGGDAESQMAVSGVARANAGDVSGILQKIAAESKKAEAILSNLKNAAAMGLMGWANTLQGELDQASASINKLVDEGSQKIDLQVTTGTAKVAVNELEEKLKSLQALADFTITGDFANSQQTVAAIQEVIGMFDKLNASQKSVTQPQINALIAAATPDSATGVVDLAKFKAVYDALKQDIADGVELNLETAEADKRLKDLRAKVRGIGEDANFSISGRVQNAGQAEAEIKRIISGMEKLDAAGKAAVAPKLGAALGSLLATDPSGLPDIAAMRTAVAALKTEFNDQLEIKVNADKAQKSVDTLKESLASIADKIGDPSQPIDRLRKAVEAANAAIAKMPAGAIKTKLEGDLNSEKVRIEAAARPGAPAPSVAGIDAAAARANAIAASATAATPAKAAANSLGADFGTAERSLASLQSNVVSLQGSLEKLPMPMQTQFIPAINKVRDAFQKLTPTSTAAEIEAVTKKAAGLERAFTRAGQAAKFGGTIGEALNAASIARTEKQLGFVRSKLLEVGATASGPVANAFNAYSAAAANAAKSGTSGTAKTKQELDGLIAKIGEALVAEGKLTASQGRAFSKSVGDVGRAGADKFALGLNQAAFAIDDFMSSTGGLEFKLRAISNNITQLGFVVGGTTGLFVGLGAVIGGQVAIGLIKWVNGGRSAEDQTKALNEALARQKSLVEELAEAFRSLGDSMSRGTFSAGGEQDRDFGRQMEEIRKKQNELARNSVADLDPEVIKERAEQNRLRGKIEKSTDPGEIVALQVKTDESKKREREAADRAVSAPPPDMEGIQDRLRKSFEAMAFAAARDAGMQRPDDPFAPAQAAAPILEQAAAVARPVGVREARDQVEERIRELTGEVEGGLLQPAQSDAAKKEIAELKKLFAGLSAPLIKEINNAANELAKASRGPAEQIRQAQEEVAEAIKAGLPGARLFQLELDKNATELEKATKKLAMVASGKDELDNPLKEDDRERLVGEARGEIDALNARRRETAAQSDAFRYERTVDPQRQIDARMGRATSNLGAAGLDDGRIARRMREIENERETIRQRSALPEFQTPEMVRGLQDAEQALNEEAAAIEAATIAIKIFADALNRASEEAKGNLNSAQQRADETRRADLGNSTPQTQEARKQAEADLERQREIERAAQTEIAVERDRLEQMQKPDAERMQQIDEELKSGTNPGDEAREQLAAERAAMEAGVSGSNSAATADVERARRRNEAAQAMAQVARDDFKAADDLGIDTTGMNSVDARNAVRAAGRGDIADEFDRRGAEADSAMVDAGFTFEERGATFWDAVTRAGEELAAALARQAEVVNEGAARLAEMDAQIAAVPAGDGRETLIREREALQAKMEDDARASQAKVDSIVDAGTAEEEFQKSAARGRELGMTDREKDKRSASATAGDISARASEIGNAMDRRSFIEQATQNAYKEAAPMLFEMDEQFQNALKSPTRAKLEAADVNTQQGQSELNRLLRGDDAAKNQNLFVLNKQLGKLEEIKVAVMANTGQVVN